MVAEHGPQTSTSSLLEPEKVILYGKKDFADVIKLRTLGWGGYPGLSQWALNVITSALIKRMRLEKNVGNELGIWERGEHRVCLVNQAKFRFYSV